MEVCVKCGIEKSGIVPYNNIRKQRETYQRQGRETYAFADEATKKKGKERLTPTQRQKLIDTLTAEMKEAAKKLEFEQAAFLRDKIKQLREEK